MNGNDYILKVENVSHTFVEGGGPITGGKKVLWNVNIAIKAGNIIGCCGPSGSGKSTLLRAILGTNPPTSGQVLLDGKPVTSPSRNIGIVYQNYALYDFMSIIENIAFGPLLDQTSIPFRTFHPFAWKKMHQQHLTDAMLMLKKVGLDEKVANLYPAQLSGGMRQRVAVGQALMNRPAILLMDEPFGALDEITRESLQMILLNLYQENLVAKKAGRRPPHTIIIVTHELDEALYVSDRVIGLSQYHPDGANGSTIVYDQPSPVYRPTDPRDFTRFTAQKEMIRKVVFNPENTKNHERYIHMWEATDEALPGDEHLAEDRI